MPQDLQRFAPASGFDHGWDRRRGLRRLALAAATAQHPIMIGVNENSEYEGAVLYVRQRNLLASQFAERECPEAATSRHFPQLLVYPLDVERLDEFAELVVIQELLEDL